MLGWGGYCSLAHISSLYTMHSTDYTHAILYTPSYADIDKDNVIHSYRRARKVS